MTKEQQGNFIKYANLIIDDFIKMGLTLDVAKKATIKVLRRNIDELRLIDDTYFIGLKKRIEMLRWTIIYIIEK